jgi:hypothetical protein
VLATYDALVGVALGAGLTYGFGALNRRHQEAREKETRWYEARFNAYAEFSRVISEMDLVADSEERQERVEFARRVHRAVGAIRLIGSREVTDATAILYHEMTIGLVGSEERDEDLLMGAVEHFVATARKDLGHPSP